MSARRPPAFEGQCPDDIGAAMLWLLDRGDELVAFARRLAARLCLIHAGLDARFFVAKGKPRR